MQVPRAIRRAAREHRAVVVVLAVAAAIRLAVEVAFRPASFFSDSYAYLGLTEGFPVSVAADRPSGYPLILKVLSLDGNALELVTIGQHLAGLAVGALVYLLLLRLGVGRLLAVAAAGLVLLDGYAIALEQFILAEAFFGFTLVLGSFLVVGERRGPWALAASGALLASAVTLRTAAIFVVPVWAAYLLWRHRELRRLAFAAAAFVVPLLVYASLYAVKTGSFGMSAADGWFLYGRIGEIADCRGLDVSREARPLCERDPGAAGKTPAFYVWGDRSPAVRRFGFITGPKEARQKQSNRVLKEFAQLVIRERPGEYAELVASDFVRYFQPGKMSPARSDEGLYLSRPLETPPSSARTDVTGTRPTAGVAGMLLDYERAVHTPRWLLGPLAVVALLALLGSFLPRLRGALPHRAEVFLMTGTGLVLLLGSVATSGFIVRYLIPAVPFLVAGGVLAVGDLLSAVRRARDERSAAALA